MPCDYKSECKFCHNKEVKFVWPISPVHITQHFGENPDIYAKFGMKAHNGIDFRSRMWDTPLGRRYVYAVAEGIIEQVRWDRTGYGVHIRQRLPDGSMCLYGHLTRPYCTAGQKVSQGERIGLTGSTGYSTGPHLHFEYRPSPIKSDNGYYGAIDPILLFPKA
jgi:murein DD-endopeptidase MepM/ murein hydrolase activator NlpD